MNSIDTRIVQMQFQHGQFIAGVSSAVKALNVLKSALNFTGVVNTKDLEVDSSGTIRGLDKVISKFEELQTIGGTAFSFLTDKATDAGKKVVDAFFGLSDISAGQSKYETYTKAVQTITNATGKSVEEVEAILKDLQKYTDETSYDFATMVSTIGKFTAAGVDLKAAEIAMEGIGNEAAKSGAGIQEANHAMYNFAQALSQGSVKLQDWKSIANANMSTKEFKETLIETAIELGILEKRGEAIGSIVSTDQEKLEAGQRALQKASKATKDRAEKMAEAQRKISKATKESTVDYKSFEQTLKDGWLTTDVLIKTLEKYADTSTPFGQSAYEAAQKALTFSDAIQAVKDSVSSGWMDTFKYLFGNLEEAIKFWTDFCNALIDFTSIFSNWRNKVLEAWHLQGGYNDMIEAAANLWQVFMNIVNGVGEALARVFPFLDPENATAILVSATKKLKDVSASILEMFGLAQEVEEEEEETLESTEKLKSSADGVASSMSELSSETLKVAENMSNVQTGLKKGMRGDNVKKLQNQLISLGFRLDKFGADGIFGPETQAALKALQREIGVTETGVLDEATKAALQTEEALKKLQNRAKKGIGIGAKGDEVKKLQTELNKYLKDSEKLAVDGIFGPKTEAALKKFQKEFGIKQTGTWDKASQAAAKAGKSAIISLNKISKKIEKGSAKADIKALQEELIKTGYITDKSVADGVFGPETEAAIKKLQKELGVKQTGIWDKATVVAVGRSKNFIKMANATSKAVSQQTKNIEKSSKKNTKIVGKTTLAMRKLQMIAKGWASIASIATKFVGSIASAAANISKWFGPLIKDVIDFAYFISAMISNFEKELDKNEIFKKITEKVTSWFEPLKTFIDDVHDKIHQFLKGYEVFLKALYPDSQSEHNTFSTFFDYISAHYPDLAKAISVIKSFVDSFTLFFGLRDPVNEAEEKMMNLSKTIEYFKMMFEHSGFWDSVVTAFNTIKDAFSALEPVLDAFKQDISDALGDDWLVSIIRYVGFSFKDFLETAGFIIEVLAEVVAFIIEHLPGAITTIRDFWDSLTYEGDEKTGKAPGIIGRITKFFKSILGITTEDDDVVEYAKSGVGPISIVTGALAEESLEGETHVNKSLKIVKGICGTIKKIFSFINIAITGNVGKDSGLKKDTIDKILAFRIGIEKVFDTIRYIFTGAITENVNKELIDKIEIYKKIINGALDFVSNTFGGIIERIAYFIGGITFDKTKLTEDVKKRIDGIKEWLGNVWKVITTIFSGKSAEGLKANIATKAIDFRNWIIKTFDTLKEVFGGIIERIAYFIGGITFDKTKLTEDVKKRIDGIKEWLGNVWKVITTIFIGKSAEGLKANIATNAIDFRNWIIKTFDTLKEVFGGIIERIAYFIGGITFDKTKLTEDVKKRIDGIKEWLGNVWKVITTIFSGKSAEGLKANTATKAIDFRNWIIKTFDTLKEVFGGIIERIAYFIGGITFDKTKLTEDVKKRIDGIKEWLGKLGNALSVLISGNLSERGALTPEFADKIVQWRNRISGVFDAIATLLTDPISTFSVLFSGKKSERGLLSSDAAEKILGFRDKIVGVISSIKDAMRGIIGSIGGILGGTKDIGDVADDIEEDIGESDFKGKVIKAGLYIAGILGALKFITGKINDFKSAIGIGEEKKEKKGLERIAESLFKIAISFGIITAAILILGKIMQPGELTRGLIGLGVVAGIIIAIFAILKAINKNGKKTGKKDKDFSVIKNIGDAIFDLAAGIGIITAALFVLGKMKATTFLNGLWKLVIILGVVVGFFGLLKLIKFDKLDIKGFWDLAAGVEILAIVVHTLSDMSWKRMGKGLAGLAGIMLLMAGLMFVMGKFGATKIKFKGFFEFGECIALIARTMKTIGKMSWDEIGKGLLGIFVIMGLMGGIIALMGYFGDKLKPMTLAVMFGGMAVAIGVFGYVLKKIKGTDPKLLYAFSISLAIALGAFVAACMFVGSGTDSSRAKSMLKGAGAIAAALGIFVAAAVIIVGGLGELDRIEGLDLRGSIERGKVILGLTAEALRDFGDKLGVNLPIIAGVLAVSLIVGLIPGGPSSLMEGAASIAAALGIIVDASAIFIGALGEIDRIPNLEFEESVKKGGEIIESIATSLSSFGEKLKLNLPIIAGILAASFIVGLIPGGKVALIGGATALAAAAGLLVDVVGIVGPGLLGLIENWTNGGLSDTIDKGGEVLESISSALARVKSGFTKVYNEDLKDFGEAMSSVRTGIEGVSKDGTLDEDMAAATEVVSKLHGFFSSLTPYNLTDASGFVTEYTTTASLLLKDVDSFGTAITNLWNGVSGISKDKNIDTDVDDSIGIVKKLKTDFFDVIGKSENMPDGSGLTKYNNNIESILGHVKTFGENIGTFHTNVGGLSSSQMDEDTSVAIAVAEKVSQFLVNLSEKADGIETNKGVIDKFFTGDTKQETVFDSIGRLGTAIKNSQESYSGISESTIVSDISAAIGVAKETGEMLASLGGQGMLSSIVDGANSLGVVKAFFEDDQYGLGAIIKSFAEKIKDVENLPEVSTIFSGFSTLANMLTTDTTLNNNFANTGATFAGAILTAFSSNDVSSAKGLVNAMLDELKKNTYKDEFIAIGKNYVVGLSEGVIFNTYLAEKAASYAANAMKQAIQKELDENSPSKVAMELGKYFVEGLAIGSRSNAEYAENSAREAANGMISSAKNAIEMINGLFSEGVDMEPVIAPVVDLSNVRNAAGSIDNMLSNKHERSFSYSGRLAGSVDRSAYAAKKINDQNYETQNDKMLDSATKMFSEKMDQMAEAMKDLKIYMDGNTLVGYVTPKVNRGLGQQAILANRLN